jgi:LmbE family N-acetylglucosaminyl deacetylase
MLSINLKADAPEGLTILCLGAHSDDIEIGCGGTLLHLKKAYPRVKFHWVVLSAEGLRGNEAAKAAELFAGDSEHSVTLKNFRDGFLPYVGAEVKNFFEETRKRVNPDVIFTHWRGDAHQDHRLISELTWNTYRDHLILEYEIPKYDGYMGRPNLFVPLEAPLVEHKVDYLFQAFQSQQSKRWFERETFLSLMRLRGMESNSPSGYAEAFHVRKVVMRA